MAELLEDLDARELTYWLAFHQVEPFGDQRQDLGHAITACTIANVWRGKGPPFKVVDFLPRFEEQQRGQPVEVVQAYFIALAQRTS